MKLSAKFLLSTALLLAGRLPAFAALAGPMQHTPAPEPSRAAGLDTALDTARIEQLTGAKGALDAKEGVFKVTLPRADLEVTAAGVRMTPPLGLTSWAAFTAPAGDGAWSWATSCCSRTR